MKTILIPISNSFFVRNFLRTDAMEIMRKAQDVRLVLLAPKDKINYYRKEFVFPNVLFDVLPDVMIHRIERFFKFLEMSSIHTRTVAMMQGSDFKRVGSHSEVISRWLFFLISRSLWWLGQFKLWRMAIRGVYFHIPSLTFSPFIKKYHPDLVFCPVMIHGEARILKEAKQNGISTVGMVLSWDNLYSKSFLRVHPDHLLVHTDRIRDQALFYGDYPKRRVVEIGIPQYDDHFKRSRVGPRDEFIRKIGGDPSRKLILYALSGKRALHIEFDIIEMLYKAIKNGEIKEKVDVLIRPYPRFDFPPQKIDELRQNYGFLAYSAMAHVGERKENWEFDNGALELLSNSLAHADLVITMYSTFFIEAAIFDKPLIGIAFDGNQKMDYWNSATRFFDWNHLADIKPLGGISLVKSREEFLRSINEYLENPRLHAEGRRAIVRTQCQFTDGKSGERIARALLSFL